MGSRTKLELPSPTAFGSPGRRRSSVPPKMSSALPSRSARRFGWSSTSRALPILSSPCIHSSRNGGYLRSPRTTNQRLRSCARFSKAQSLASSARRDSLRVAGNLPCLLHKAFLSRLRAAIQCLPGRRSSVSREPHSRTRPFTRSSRSLFLRIAQRSSIVTSLACTSSSTSAELPTLPSTNAFLSPATATSRRCSSCSIRQGVGRPRTTRLSLLLARGGTSTARIGLSSVGWTRSGGSRTLRALRTFGAQYQVDGLSRPRLP